MNLQSHERSKCTDYIICIRSDYYPTKSARLTYRGGLLGDLNGAEGPGGVHPRGLVHRVPPDVEDRLRGADDAAHQRPDADACSASDGRKREREREE